jgi:CheY-like chemotaxis protein
MSGERILIVDDHPANLRLVSFLLRSKGFDVRVAASAVEALAMIDAELPELILMDIQLPEMDGLALTRLLRERPETESVVIVAVTAYAMKGDEQKALDAGCDGYVTKPIDTRALPALIEKYLLLRAVKKGAPDGDNDSSH